MGVTQEHPQNADTVADRVLGQPRSGALDDEGGQDRRRELPDRLDTDPLEVGLEANEVMTIGEHRGRTQATLLDQVVEETRDHSGEGLGVVRPAGGLEAGEHDREQLLDRAADLLRHRPRRASACVVARDGVRDERVHVRRQLADGARPSPTSELAEGERDRHPTPDALSAVALLDHPRQVRLNLGGDPRAADPIDRLRLHEVLLQHGTTSSLIVSQRKQPVVRRRRYVAENEPAGPSTTTATGVVDPRPHNGAGHRTRKMFRGTFSGTSRAGTPPKNANASTWAAVHSA